MKLLDFLAVRLISKDTASAVKVYNALYSQPNVVYKPAPQPKPIVKVVEKIVYKPAPQPKPIVKVVEKIVYVPAPQPVAHKPSPKPVTKKDELLESLQYLNNKKSKTKQDRESIDIIKSILKNMK
jgi:hypothetical protein